MRIALIPVRPGVNEITTRNRSLRSSSLNAYVAVGALSWATAFGGCVETIHEVIVNAKTAKPSSTVTARRRRHAIFRLRGLLSAKIL